MVRRIKHSIAKKKPSQSTSRGGRTIQHDSRSGKDPVIVITDTETVSQPTLIGSHKVLTVDSRRLKKATEAANTAIREYKRK